MNSRIGGYVSDMKVWSNGVEARVSCTRQSVASRRVTIVDKADGYRGFVEGLDGSFRGARRQLSGRAVGEKEIC